MRIKISGLIPGLYALFYYSSLVCARLPMPRVTTFPFYRNNHSLYFSFVSCLYIFLLCPAKIKRSRTFLVCSASRYSRNGLHHPLVVVILIYSIISFFDRFFNVGRNYSLSIPAQSSAFSELNSSVSISVCCAVNPYSSAI